MIDSNSARSLRDTLYAINKPVYDFVKANHDTADAFSRLINNILNFSSVSLNRAGAPNEIDYKNDTLFIFKNVHAVAKEENVFKKDSLDYFISIKSFTSIQKGSYYNIQFDLSIQSKKIKYRSVLK